MFASNSRMRHNLYGERTSWNCCLFPSFLTTKNRANNFFFNVFAAPSAAAAPSHRHTRPPAASIIGSAVLHARAAASQTSVRNAGRRLFFRASIEKKKKNGRRYIARGGALNGCADDLQLRCTTRLLQQRRPHPVFYRLYDMRCLFALVKLSRVKRKSVIQENVSCKTLYIRFTKLNV